MNYSKLLIHTALLLAIPSLTLHSQDETPLFTISPKMRSIIGPSSNPDLPITYDDLLRFLDEVESGELEERCSREDLEEVQEFIINLARLGLLPGDEEELEKDIAELLSHDDNEDSSQQQAYEFQITPALFAGKKDVLHPVNWAKRKWAHVRHFIRDHKKFLILGTVVTVAGADGEIIDFQKR